MLSLPPGKVGQNVYRIIGEALGDPDPYADLKRFTNGKISSIEPHFAATIAGASDPLRVALQLAILGNTIDFAAELDVDIDGELVKLDHDNLAIDDSPSLFDDFRKARIVLYIGDNAGEIVFDKLFVQELINHFPEAQITFTVRSGPIINDATMQDANEVGLTDIVPYFNVFRF